MYKQVFDPVGDSLGLSSTERDKFIQKNEIPIYDGSQEYLLWMGCMGSYDPQGREIVTSRTMLRSTMERCSSGSWTGRSASTTSDSLRGIGGRLWR